MPLAFELARAVARGWLDPADGYDAIFLATWERWRSHAFHTGDDPAWMFEHGASLFRQQLAALRRGTVRDAQR